MLEVGRKDKLNVSERLCPLCIVPNIETEYHFCIECPFYYDLRRTLLPENCLINPCQNTFCNLLISCNPTIINNLAKFVFLAFKKRAKFLNIAPYTC